MTDPVLDFWFDFASTYSYLAAARIRPLAARGECAGALSPVPARADLQGAGLGHFAVQSLRGEGPLHVARHGAACRRSRSLPFRRPDPFPQNSLLPARVALFGLAQGWGEDFSVAVFHGAVRRGRPDRRAAHPGRDPVALERRCRQPHSKRRNRTTIKLRLRSEVEAAQKLGVFGAPSFTTADGELFWGNDRLEQALSLGEARR